MKEVFKIKNISIPEFDTDAFIMIHAFDGYTIKKYHTGDAFSDEKIIEIRIFDSKKEIKLWKSGNKLQSRILPDDFDYSEQQEFSMKLRGTIARQVEQLGSLNGDLYLQTVQYIDSNEIGQAGYVDYRINGFSQNKNN